MICFIIEETLNSATTIHLLNLIARIQIMKKEDTRFDFQAKELSRDVRECLQNDTMKSFRLIRNDSTCSNFIFNIYKQDDYYKPKKQNSNEYGVCFD